MPVVLSIVIVTYNSQHVISALLDSIADSARVHGHAFSADVVVVDNGSTDGTRDVVARREDCLLIAADNRGYSAGINAGIDASAPGTPVLILNPDVRLAPGAVPAMLAALGGRRGVIAPRVLDERGEPSFSLRRDPSLPRALGLTRTRLPLLSEYVQESIAYEVPGAADWALGAALLVDRRCLEEVGEWDESYFLYSEETDYCARARDRGWQVWFEPAAEVVHIGGQSGQSEQTHAMQVVNRVRFYGRRHRAPAAWAYFALTALSEASWILRGNPRSRFALTALLRPSRRPGQLGASGSLLPR